MATGPGRGKTTLMQRGMLQLMRTQFKDRWSGRSFSWDLVVTSPTDTEVRLMQDYSISGFQSILALRLLHQAINHNSYYVEMLEAPLIVKISKFQMSASRQFFGSYFTETREPVEDSCLSDPRLITHQ